jgi:hypothetical protein
MVKQGSVVCFLMFAAVFLSCTHPLDPYSNPDNAIIQPDSSLTTLKDTLKISTAYTCSVNVFLPNLVDSFFVRIGDSTIQKGAVNGTSPIIFSFVPVDTGAYQVRFVIAKSNGSKDSLVKNGLVVPLPSLAPHIVPVSGSIHLFLGDSAVVKFILTDPDSDLVGYTTRLSLDQDTSKSHALDFSYSLTSHIKLDTIFRTLKGAFLLPGLSAPLICYAQAIDRKSNYSNVASCSVFVADTTPPTIAKLRPITDSIFILPDTIIAQVDDNWGVDSVKLNGAKMSLSHDTAGYIVPALAPGTTSFDTIAAWDKAGNITTIVFPRIYSGPKVYPPEVKNLSRTVFTGHRFDTLFLDTCVKITDPAATTTADTQAYITSLSWLITDTAGAIVNYGANYNVLARKFVVPAPTDTLWDGTITLTFKAIAASGPSSAPKTVNFIVKDRPGTPVITTGNQSKLLGNSFDTLFLDTCAKDPNDSSATLNWTIKSGKFFKADSLLQCPPCVNPPCLICLKPTFRRRVAIVPVPDTTIINPATWTGSDTLYFTVKDPGGLSKTKPIVFTKWKFIIRQPIINPVLPKKKQAKLSDD